MKPPPIIIWGASRHARVVAEILELRGELEIYGFIDDVNPDRTGEQFAGKEVLGGRSALDRALERGVTRLIFGFGRSAEKLALAPELIERGFSFESAIHPGAHFSTKSRIGAGTVVKAGAVIDPGAQVGEHAIVGANAVVTHGSILEDGARMAAGAILGADVRVGRGALVGIGAMVTGGVTIGEGALVGAGSVVVNDVPPGKVVVGSPARVTRDARPEDY